MAHDRVVYRLGRGRRKVYCSSFAIVSALLGMGWALADWGPWARYARKLSARPDRGALLRASPGRRAG